MESEDIQVRLIGLAESPRFLPGNCARSLPVLALHQMPFTPPATTASCQTRAGHEVMESYARPRVTKIIVFTDFMTFYVNPDGNLASFQRGVGYSA